MKNGKNFIKISFYDQLVKILFNDQNLIKISFDI